ncbi:efflux RND transporter periplasmic adaptor subunit [Sulfurimonas paralvinellae]|uniref:HlyD family efflux transporter periplasmic adaptor subunit n=1 Tax=Sulfurimonas paralvinellae TaxID=317658 RepID=A0A7M1B712_9BACT|nr:efflux RND transporter periplasmic adaptor subunit [Sulfurimonas paralvinellae]QOP45481.1 HlyD family efflux transporter periplasmic adaptor subunit [Sulfurimonas paralvinellae]
MNRYIKYVVMVIVVVFVAALFYNKVYIPKSTYAKVTAQKGNIDISVFGIGNVSARDIYTVNSQVPAKIKEIKTDAGEWVKKGDLLVVLDAVDLPQLLEEVKISVQKATLNLEAANKELQTLLAQKKLALITYKRYEKLKEQSFASQSEYDKAKADLDVLSAQIGANLAQIASAKAEIKRAKKSVEALREKLKQYKIYAPIDGYVIQRTADSAQSVLTSQPILKIVDPKTVWIQAYIDERISGSIKVDQHATITLRSKADEKLHGYVKRIVPQSDSVTQEREVDIAFEKLPIPFYINEQAEVSIVTKQLKDVLTIPVDAIVHSDGKSAVWLNKKGHASLYKINVLGIDDTVAAVKELPQNAVILIPSTGKKTLREGMRVH